MRHLFHVLIAALFVGCIGDAALPVVSSTPIANKKITIDLGGPDPKGHYHYYINTQDGDFTHRFLGPLPTDKLTPATVEELPEGQFRVQWGPDDRVFCIIDVENSLIVSDSNDANPPNEPFGNGAPVAR